MSRIFHFIAVFSITLIINGQILTTSACISVKNMSNSCNFFDNVKMSRQRLISVENGRLFFLGSFLLIGHPKIFEPMKLKSLAINYLIFII